MSQNENSLEGEREREGGGEWKRKRIRRSSRWEDDSSEEVEWFNPLVEANGRGECKNEKRISSSRGQGSNNASSPLLPLRFIVGGGKWLGKGGPRVFDQEGTFFSLLFFFPSPDF